MDTDKLREDAHATVERHLLYSETTPLSSSITPPKTILKEKRTLKHIKNRMAWRYKTKIAEIRNGIQTILG